ncbi:MAG: carbamoyl phosphate synthase small subunit [Clostridia bacterium]|nr:carbamoyl phosphate synthase small subunit [Clostridia bacterium]
MAYLVLENGMAFEGKRMGAKKDVAGELVFTTGVVGYVEQLSDPANAGLLVMQTFPVIGNYGVAEEDTESAYAPAGYVVRSLCDTPSSFRSTGSLNDYLVKKGIPGICGVDTRHLTAVLREEGTMRAMICDEIPAAFPKEEKVPIQPCEKAVYPALGEEKKQAVLWDFGVKCSLTHALNQRGWRVTAVPFDTKAEEIFAMNPDAVVLSGGPEKADISEEVLKEIKTLLGKIPLLAAGLGHPLVAKALGGSVKKMHIGHRGQNQPVFCTLDGRTYTTSQNHGLSVDENSLKDKGEMVYKNLNDGGCEGMLYPSLGCLSVQFDPNEQVLALFETLMGGDR